MIHHVGKQSTQIVVQYSRRAAAKLALTIITRPHIPNGFYVVNYHQICADSTARYLSSVPNMPQVFTSSENFVSHLDFFSDQFLCVPLSEGLRLWKQGHAAKNKILSLTFDDGLAGPLDFLDCMKSIRLQPGLFVCGDPLIRNRPLAIHKELLVADYSSQTPPDGRSRDTLFDQLKDSGHCDDELFSQFIRKQYLSAKTLANLIRDGRIDSYGSHTWTHNSLAHHDLATQIEEIQACHAAIENAVNIKTLLFSYPFGKMNRQSFMTPILAHLTAEYVFHCNGGINQDPTCGPSVLRVSVKNHCVDDLHRLLRLQYRR